jgi:hypothetical protein
MKVHYYHGSATKLEIGDLLLPPRQTGVDRYSDADQDAVYVSTDLLYAIFIAVDDRRTQRFEPPPRPVWVYQVEPIGELTPHITEILWGFDGNSERGAPMCSGLYTVPKAKILTRFAVPAFFDSVRVDLIEAYFNTHAHLTTKRDQFRRETTYAEPDNPDDPDEWFTRPTFQISRGKQQWETLSEGTWKWLQNKKQRLSAAKKEREALLNRLRQFLDNRKDELIEAAAGADDVVRDLLRVLNFHFEYCSECGGALNERDIRRDNGLCLHCYAAQPD